MMGAPREQARALLPALRSPWGDAQRRAMFKVGEQKYTELARAVLAAGESSSDPRTQESAAWALGKLGYSPALPFLIRLSQAHSYKVVKAASWALGEIGGAGAAAALRHAYDAAASEELRQAIGGALKKLEAKPVRAPAEVVAQRLVPPKSANPEANQIVARLEQPDAQLDQAEVLRLRERLRQLDPEFFQHYLKFVSEKPKVKALLHSKRVYP